MTASCNSIRTRTGESGERSTARRSFARNRGTLMRLSAIDAGKRKDSSRTPPRTSELQQDRLHDRLIGDDNVADRLAAYVGFRGESRSRPP